jgi:hypothetical protein
LNLNKHCHKWFDKPKYGTICIIHDNTCNDNNQSKENMFIGNIRKWLHSFCNKILRSFKLSFWFFFNFLCLSHYNFSSMVLLNSENPYFLLSTTCVHSLPMCVGHCKFFSMLPQLETLFIYSTHCN